MNLSLTTRRWLSTERKTHTKQTVPEGKDEPRPPRVYYKRWKKDRGRSDDLFFLGICWSDRRLVLTAWFTVGAFLSQNKLNAWTNLKPPQLMFAVSVTNKFVSSLPRKRIYWHEPKGELKEEEAHPPTSFLYIKNTHTKVQIFPFESDLMIATEKAARCINYTPPPPPPHIHTLGLCKQTWGRPNLSRTIHIDSSIIRLNRSATACLN